MPNDISHADAELALKLYRVLGFLVLLTAVTICAAVLLSADGARHPVTVASIIVAVAVLCGGPSLMAAVRRRAERALTA